MTGGVLITGGHGFIGRHLARHLATAGHQVVALGHGHWPDKEAQFWGVRRWLNGDVRTSNLERLRLDHGSPELIFHLAGGSSVGASLVTPREDFDRTVVSTADLLEWARREAPDARIVVVSSAAVYGADRSGLISEDASPLVPFSPYGHHKRAMEQLCLSYGQNFGVPLLIARLFSVYGEGLRKQLLWDLCTRLAEGPEELLLGGTGEEVRDWTHVSDVAALLARLSGKASAAVPIYNGGSGKGTIVRDIANLVVRAWDKPVHVRFSGVSRPGDPVSLVADPGRLGEAGFRFSVGVEQGIADYVRWFRREGGVPA